MDVCPCCGATDKTSKHLLACKHEDLKNVRRAAYIKIKKTCDKEKLPLQFTMVFLNVIHSVLGTTATPVFDNLSAPMAPATLAQTNIGFYNMVLCFMATEWTTILKKLGVEHPQA